MARKADCRKCIHFTPVERMSEECKQRALKWVERHRPGQPLLGWCAAYHRPVTYYEGTCPAFTAFTKRIRIKTLDGKVIELYWGD